MSTQPRSIQFAGESYAEKAERKFKENPAVPIGALATTAALTMAMFKMRSGQAKSFNNWLRMRVLFQGLTIVAVCWGTWNLGAKSAAIDRSAELEEEQKRREEKVARERAEFEGRLKAAEEMHNEMTAVNAASGARAALLSKLPESNPSPPANTARPPPPQETTTSPKPASPPKSGWKSWLGL